MDYPVADYYRDQIVTAVDIKQTARTWVAALLIEDPKSGKLVIRIYEWKRRGVEAEWKRHGVIALDKFQQIRDLVGSLESMSHRVLESQAGQLKERIKATRGVAIAKH